MPNLFKYRVLSIKYQVLNRKGVSLIEVLIALSIIAMITVVAIPNFRNFNQEQELDILVATYLNNLKLAQSSTQSFIKCTDGRESKQWIVRYFEDGYDLQVKCINSATGVISAESPASRYAVVFPVTVTTFQHDFGSGATDCNQALSGNIPCGQIVFEKNTTKFLDSNGNVLSTQQLTLQIRKSTINPLRRDRSIVIDAGGAIREL